MATTCLVTGATGFVGSHVTEALVEQGHRVVAFVRDTSAVAWLRQLGVATCLGDVTDGTSVQKAMEGVTDVVHCAAKVGDWGCVEAYRSVNVEGLRNLLEFCPRDLHRFIHVSSLGVYAARDHFGADESEPLPVRHVDGYTQSKVEAEELAMRAYRERHLPITILRPGFVYGPRDRTVLPRLLESLAKRHVMYVGSGEQALNTIYVGNLVDAVLLVLANPIAVGQTYNLTDGERVSERRFLQSVADLAGLDRPKYSVPRPLARFGAWFMEGACRLLNTAEPPRITQARLKFLGLNLDFSIEKAKRELGYRPGVGFDDGIEEAITWWKTQRLRETEANESAALARASHRA